MRRPFESVSEMMLYLTAKSIAEHYPCVCHGDFEKACPACECAMAMETVDSIWENREARRLEALVMAAQTNPFPGL